MGSDPIRADDLCLHRYGEFFTSSSSCTPPPLKSSQEAQIPSLRPNFQPLWPNISLETQIPALRPNSGLDAQILASRHKFQPRQHYLSPEAQILAPRPHYQPQGPNANCWKEREKKIPLTCESIGHQPLRGCPAAPLPCSLPRLQAKPT